MQEVSKLCYRVTEDDVIHAQNQLKSSLLLHIDGINPIAEDIGRQLITYGRRIPFAELFARIDAVDAATIKRVANRFIFDQLQAEMMEKQAQMERQMAEMMEFMKRFSNYPHNNPLNGS